MNVSQSASKTAGRRKTQDLNAEEWKTDPCWAWHSVELLKSKHVGEKNREMQSNSSKYLSTLKIQ